MCMWNARDVALQNIKYAALSYVWGCAKQVKLEEQIEPELFRQNSLLSSHLPQAIRDAIEAAKSLLIPLLCIDVLCIRQGVSDNDIEDRQYQLKCMGDIYGNARITIVATGDDANSGLPGLRPGSRVSEQLVDVRVLDPNDQHNCTGLDLVSMCSSSPPWTEYSPSTSVYDTDIDRTLWNTRTWTI